MDISCLLSSGRASSDSRPAVPTGRQASIGRARACDHGGVWDNLAAFATVWLVALAIPGPDFVLVLRHASRGSRTGRAAGLGVACGLCVHLAAAVLGVSAILAHSAAAFTVVKLLGAAYLCLLGARALLGSFRGGRRVSAAVDGPVPVGRGRAFGHGFLTNVLNPKAVVYFLSLLPQFFDSSAPVLPQTLLFGGTAVVIALVWWMLFVALVGQVRAVLARPAVRRGIDRVTGVLFLGFGVRLAATRA